MNKPMRFAASEECLLCPVCGLSLQIKEKSLLCPNRHCFDIAKSGYVNLLPHSSKSDLYNKDSFAARKTIMQKGYYAHILNGLYEALLRLQVSSPIIDAGCGEGYFARELSEMLQKSFLAFDISKDSILLASKADHGLWTKWIVADIAKLPLREKTSTALINIFSPANYAEFRRVLRPNAPILKIVPTENHLKELRSLAGKAMRHEEYSNETIVAHFSRHFSLQEKIRLSMCFDISKEDALCFARMTPLLFSTDIDSLDLSDLKKLSIEADLLIGC